MKFAILLQIIAESPIFLESRGFSKDMS